MVVFTATIATRSTNIRSNWYTLQFVVVCNFVVVRVKKTMAIRSTTSEAIGKQFVVVYFNGGVGGLTSTILTRLKLILIRSNR